MTRPNAYPVKILGVDPGSRVAGFACLASKKVVPRAPADFEIIDAGVIRLRAELSYDQRIARLHRTISGLIDTHGPSACVIEKAFYGINVKSALRLGEARGALMSAIHQHAVPFYEVAPTVAKKAVTGHGGASKEEVRLAIEVLLSCQLQDAPLDVSDALALALCHGLTLAATDVGSMPKASENRI